MVFQDNFVNVFNKHVPKKRKNFMGNYKLHVSQDFEVGHYETQLPSDKQNCKKKEKQNLVTKLNKQKNVSIISKITLTDSKNFCNKCNNFATSAYFSNKYNSGDSKILLTENEEIINEKTKAADVFNSYFESVTESLRLFNWALEPYD